MALSHQINEEGNFLITCTILGWGTTTTTTVEWFPDLSQKRVNAEPFAESCPASRAWFNRYSRDRFPKAVE